ncbi:MAG TPA: hypothetical protein VHC48_21565 [Puia sp.]|nr:hypothetical protein [Puia sp.]
MKLFPSGYHALFIFCMMSVAPGTKGEAGTVADWRFSNFGLHAGGTVIYGTNTISISTRYTRHCFFDSDHYSFAYQVRPFPYDDCSSLSVTVKVGRVDGGSAGIMMRSDSSLGAANVHLETSATGEIFLFYRKTKDDQTSYIHLATLSFPLELKLVRQGNAFTPWYKRSNEWMKGSPVMVAAGMEMLTGFYACSGEEFQAGMVAGAGKVAKAIFSNYRFSYKENYIPPVQDYHDTTPVPKDVLLKDNFDDGSLSNSPAAVNNPIWQGIEYGYLPVDPRGGRYWKKTGDGVFYLGDKKWTDYQFSIGLLFDKNNESKSECTILLRHQDIAVYSKMERYYAVTFRNGNRLIFEKNIPGQGLFSRTVMLPDYFDGKWHRLKVKLLDRHYEVYYDDGMVAEGVDTLQPVTYGNIGLRFTNVSVGLDNLEVEGITDPVNGDLDNYLMDYFDTPIPAYLEKYGKK